MAWPLYMRVRYSGCSGCANLWVHPCALEFLTRKGGGKRREVDRVGRWEGVSRAEWLVVWLLCVLCEAQAPWLKAQS